MWRQSDSRSPIGMFLAKTAALAVALVLITSFAGSGALAVAKKAKTGSLPQDSLVSTEFGQMKEAEDFIRGVLKRAEGLTDYSFECKITTYKKGKQVKEGGNFYFKKPNLMRVEVTEGGKKGALAIVGKDGKVRGHLGGLLKMFTGTLPRDSHMLRSANNYSMVDSDFETLLKALLDDIAKGERAYVTVNPVSVAHSKEKVFVVENYKGADKDRKLTQRMFIDVTNRLPDEWILYTASGEINSITDWRNVKVNSNLPDELFDIKHHK